MKGVGKSAFITNCQPCQTEVEILDIPRMHAVRKAYYIQYKRCEETDVRYCKIRFWGMSRQETSPIH